MKIKKIFCVVLSAVLLAVCLPVCVSAEQPTAEYVDGEIIFEYTPDSTYLFGRSAGIFSKLKSLGVTDIKELETYDSNYYTSSVSTEPVTYTAKTDSDVLETCRRLEKLDGISYAEPNYILETDSYTTPSVITNPSVNYTNYEKWYLETALNIPAAWEKYQTCGENVVIAVIDNGFYTETSSFPEHLWDDGNGNHGWNTANNTSDISPVYKVENGVSSELSDTVHGTNVAGIIGIAANKSNFIGAAYGSTLMLLKAAIDYTSGDTRTKFTSASVTSAIDFARNNGANIINMSLGSAAHSSAIKNAVARAYNSGIVLISSAGNAQTGTATQPFYPAADENVIGVMASDMTDTTILADFSNFDENDGQYYDITAPGVGIIGSSLLEGKVSRLSGTSQAAPLVASCAALFLSVYPGTSPEKVYDAIKKSPTKRVKSNPEATTSTYTYKILDAVELLDYGKVKPEINFNLSTQVMHNLKKGYLYGLDEDFIDIASYVTVTAGTGTEEFIPTKYGNGTGSVLNIYTTTGELYRTYTIILFGDVNGDCKIDGRDAVIISCLQNNMGEYSDFIKYAADTDGDNELTDADVQLTADYAIGLDYISQVR